MRNMLARFIREDEGQDLIEYGLLAGIITAGAIGSIVLIGPRVSAYFLSLWTAMPVPN
jgi:Flp pilus assembly pilin Flp